jgi:hypoxanthine-guanine phosphoribosyltransferase
MITASIGSFRFESGPSYHFNGSSFEELKGVILDPSPTVEYVNTLPGVDTTQEEMRQVAASGIARLAINEGFELRLLERAGEMLASVCGGSTVVDEADFTDRLSGNNVFHGIGLTNQEMDSASVLATRKNKAEETAGVIRTEAPADEGYFVIGLANGGLISAARTYLHLGEGDHAFGMVRYSRYKSKDKEPNMYPFPSERKDWLRRSAEGRQVVVLDEDYSTGETLKKATNYFAGLLDTKVLGIAPVGVRRDISYKPLVVKSV